MDKIAFLATGDEIIVGDIVNTNTQMMAEVLFNQGYQIGLHLACSDRVEEITAAIQYLLTEHQVLIITGGLGPTTDDNTRYALAKAVGKELFLHEPSLAAIVARLTRFNFPMTPGNRQQALFPEDAEILGNAEGTAPGCHVVFQNKHIYMLPGPPGECLPMFHQYVLPCIESFIAKQTRIFKKWRLFGVSESHIADQVEALIAPYACLTGYRFHRPYLDCKFHFEDAKQAEEASEKLVNLFAPHIICTADTTALATLQRHLQGEIAITLCDQVTSGRLQSGLQQPNTRAQLQFLEKLDVTAATHLNWVQLSGLKEYWLEQNSAETKFILDAGVIQKNGEQMRYHDAIMLPLRGTHTLTYAVEYAAYWIRRYLVGREQSS